MRLKHSRQWLVGAVLATSAICPSARAAGDPAADYAKLFGDEEKKVLATTATKDDLAFANKLLASAQDLKDDPGLQRYIFERVVALTARDPAGVSVAIDAAKRVLTTAAGVEKLTWQSKLIDLYQTQYKTATGQKRNEAGAALLPELDREVESLVSQSKLADAVKRLKDAQSIAQTIRSPKADDYADRLKEMQARQLAADRLDKLRLKFESQGGDLPVLEKLILGYLLEVNDGTTAKKLAASHPDKKWESDITAATKGLDGQSEDALLTLSDFYRSAVDKVTDPVAKRNAAERSFMAMVRFLKQHDKQDATRLRIQQSMDSAGKILDGLPGPSQSKIVIWNAFHAKTAGAAVITVTLSLDGIPVWKQQDLPIEWGPRDAQLALSVNRPFDAIRVEISRWNATTGGLNEIQVIRNNVNVALGKPVTGSGEYSPQFAASHVTDGITSSAELNKGYWMLPVGKPGWIEVRLRQ